MAEERPIVETTESNESADFVVNPEFEAEFAAARAEKKRLQDYLPPVKDRFSHDFDEIRQARRRGDIDQGQAREKFEALKARAIYAQERGIFLQYKVEQYLAIHEHFDFDEFMEWGEQIGVPEGYPSLSEDEQELLETFGKDIKQKAESKDILIGFFSDRAREKRKKNTGLFRYLPSLSRMRGGEEDTIDPDSPAELYQYFTSHEIHEGFDVKILAHPYSLVLVVDEQSYEVLLQSGDAEACIAFAATRFYTTTDGTVRPFQFIVSRKDDDLDGYLEHEDLHAQNRALRNTLEAHSANFWEADTEESRSSVWQEVSDRVAYSVAKFEQSDEPDCKTVLFQELQHCIGLFSPYVASRAKDEIIA